MNKYSFLILLLIVTMSLSGCKIGEGCQCPKLETNIINLEENI